MLIVDVSKIPPEGLDLTEELAPEPLGLGREDFELQPGASLACHIEPGDEETVHVKGHLAASLGIECGRCLEPFSLRLEQDLELFYLPHRKGDDPEDEVELSERDMVIAYYAEHRIDLGEMVREQLLLAVPMKRLCSESCLGLCSKCGTNRNRRPCDCVTDEPDPRLQALARLLK